MVWIYGGAFIMGDAGEFGMYDGTNLVNNQDVVFVSFNYRLASLGFIVLDELKAENPHNLTGNYAIRDQILALRAENLLQCGNVIILCG